MKQTSVHIARDHPAFAGHFPGRPIVPGVLLLAEAIRAIAADAGLEVGRWEIATCKFLRPVGPGAKLVIRHEFLPSGAARFEMSEAGRVVAAGTVTPVPIERTT